MSGLSESERETLAAVMAERRNECRRTFMYDPQIPAYVDALEPIVDQIAAARVKAALEAAAVALDDEAAEYADDWIWDAAESITHAARIVRDAIPKPSQQPEDRPLCPPAKR